MHVQHMSRERAKKALGLVPNRCYVKMLLASALKWASSLSGAIEPIARKNYVWRNTEIRKRKRVLPATRPGHTKDWNLTLVPTDVRVVLGFGVECGAPMAVDSSAVNDGHGVRREREAMWQATLLYHGTNLLARCGLRGCL